MAKPANAAERRHFQRISEMPCLVCNRWPVDVHHVIGYADRMGRAPKRHDRVTPLCKEHHDVQHGPLTSVHALGHRGFYEAYQIDLMQVAEQLWESGL